MESIEIYHSYGVSMEFHMESCGFSKESIGNIPGIANSNGVQWIPYGIPVDSVRNSCGLHWNSSGFHREMVIPYVEFPGKSTGIEDFLWSPYGPGLEHLAECLPG